MSGDNQADDNTMIDQIMGDTLLQSVPVQMDALGKQLQQARVEAKELYENWNPIDEKREELKRDFVNRALLRGIAMRVPNEKELMESVYGPQEKWDEDAVLVVPDWMDPFYLRFSARLEDIGVPDDRPDFEAIRFGLTTKTKRTDPSRNAMVVDYTDLGWPRSLGSPVRYVTPEEDHEIHYRLTHFGLKKPGSEVPIVDATLAQILKEENTPPEWLIEGLLRRGGAMMVYGPSGVGKTWLTHTLMFLTAVGQGLGIENPQKDQRVLQAGKHDGARVYLVDGEMIRADIAERARVLCSALELDGQTKETALENIKVLGKATQDHRAEFVDLADREWLHRIIEFCKAQEIDVVIFDNLATLTPTLEDENDATSWSSLNDMVVALKREGIGVILVHHSSKAGGYRGSSNIVTTLETVVGLQKPEGTPSDGDARFKVVVDKSRAHGRPTVDGQVLRLQDGKWVVDVDEFGLAPEAVKELLSLRHVNQTELGAALGKHQSTIARTLGKAIELGLITKSQITDAFGKAKRLRKQDESGELENFDTAFEDCDALDI